MLVPRLISRVRLLPLALVSDRILRDPSLRALGAGAATRRPLPRPHRRQPHRRSRFS